MNQASRVLASSLGDKSFQGKDGDNGSESAIVTRESIALRAWKKAVGTRLAGRTHPLKLVRDRLVIEVEDDVWRTNLWGLRYQILKNLQNCIGPGIVGDLEFRVMPPRREPQRAAALTLDLQDEASGIEDPGLRRNYIRARARETAARARAAGA